MPDVGLDSPYLESRGLRQESADPYEGAGVGLGLPLPRAEKSGRYDADAGLGLGLPLPRRDKSGRYDADAFEVAFGQRHAGVLEQCGVSPPRDPAPSAIMQAHADYTRLRGKEPPLLKSPRDAAAPPPAEPPRQPGE